MKAKRSFLKHPKSTYLVLAISASMSVAAIAAPAKSSAISEAESSQSIDAAAPLSLIQVLAYALDHNPQRQAAWSAVKAAKAGIDTAKSAGGLQVGLSGNVANQWGLGPQGDFIPPGGVGRFTDSNKPRWRETLGVDANLPIYTGGKVKANKKVAAYNYQKAVAQAIGVEQQLFFNTTVDYLDILRNQQLVMANNSDVIAATEHYRVAKLRYDVGASAKLDFSRSAADLATAQQNLIEAQNALSQSKADLNTIMGRKPQTPLQILPLKQLDLPTPFMAKSLGDTNTDGGKSTYVKADSSIDLESSPTVANGEQLAIIAGNTNATLAALQAELGAANASVDVAKAGKKPSVGLSLTGLLSNPVSYLGRFILSLGGSLVQNLFDSGRTSSQVQAARAKVEKLKFTYQNSALNVANQIEQSLLTLNSAKQREIHTAVAVASEQEALRVAQLGYRDGSQRALDVSVATADLLEAQTADINARFDVAASQAQLAVIVGIFTDQGEQAYQQSLALNKVANEHS